MALKKKITLNSGVAVSYHRIVSLNVITNVNNIIEVASYTSEEKRHEELEALLDGKSMNVYIHTRYISAPYDQNMTVASAYDWICTNVDELKNAKSDISA